MVSMRPAGAAAPDSRQAVIDRIVAASVKITIEREGRRLTSASGVVVASHLAGPGTGAVSYVLTAAHALESLDSKDGGQVFVHLAHARAAQRKFAATVSRRGRPDVLDLALLRVPGIAVLPVELSAEEQVRLGEEIMVVGFPWGKRLGLFGGIVSQIPSGGGDEGASDSGADQSIVIDASSSKGVSGGGVFRAAAGSLLGIVEGYQTASIAVKDHSQTYSVRVPMPGETFVVPIMQIRPFLEEAGLLSQDGFLGESQARR